MLNKIIKSKSLKHAAGSNSNEFVLFFGHGKTEMRGGPVIFLSLYERWSYTEKYIIYEKSYIQAIKKLGVFLKNKKISALILENEYFTEVFLALLLKAMNGKLIIYGPAYHIPARPKLGTGFINSIIHYVDYRLGLWLMSYIYSGIYTENSFMKNYIKSLNKNQDVIIESPGIKEDNIIPLQDVKNLNRDIDFLYLTTMSRNKGIYDFLTLIKEIQKEHKHIKTAIAGYATNEMLDYINQFLKNNNIQNIEIYPNINESDKYKLYSRSKIYVLPSVEDGIPITFYEAWSYGVIVIAYELNTYSDILNYIIPVESGNISELVYNCSKVYNNYKSIFYDMVTMCYNYSSNHSYYNGINKIITSVYKKINLS